MLLLVIGSAAAIVSMISFVPQAWRIIKTRNTEELVTGTWILSVVGFGLWTTYGALLAQAPIVVENAVCFLLAAFILTMKLLPQRKKEAVADALTPDLADADHGDRR